jgi:REP element-mobilizing transposase RayT
MPRPPRVHVPDGFYHVVLRRNHREVLFGRAADRQVLNDIVADVVRSHGARVQGFCWMSNHLHALLQVADSPFRRTMQRIAMRYARHRHKSLQTTGHLFERRYRARLIQTDAYFLAVLRYIHLNPVLARIVADPADYPWSSHRTYLGTNPVRWVTTEFGLSLFCADRAQAGSEFVQAPRLDDPAGTGESGLSRAPHQRRSTALPLARACAYPDSRGVHHSGNRSPYRNAHRTRSLLASRSFCTDTGLRASLGSVAELPVSQIRQVRHDTSKPDSVV